MSLPADEKHRVDLFSPNVRVGQAPRAGLDRSLEQVVRQALVRPAGEEDIEVLGARGAGRDVGQADLGGLDR
jgi:hypothetical protein